MKTSTLAAFLGALLLATPATGQSRIDDLAEEVGALRGATDAWRTIRWGRCLADAYETSKATGKPIFMVAIAGDPTGRC